MGLDSYIYKREIYKCPNCNHAITGIIGQVELYYYRKDHELHNIIALMWAKREKGRVTGEFNCEEIDLSSEDLDYIIKEYARQHKKSLGLFTSNSAQVIRDLGHCVELAKTGKYIITYDSSW